ncbi:hypothetical protein HID58_058677 [Brassica napus]|uniref:Uncharacterized protein n=1 Tax=Brassica napus TaxID=3708 RepID=A0ABQ7ZQU0_BRANA|nr:hypothetical protein HID58_058677 [Brassica napus]
MLSSPYFTELYLARSSARPRLLFAVYRSGGEDLCFYSSPQPQLPHDKSSLVVAADYHTTFPQEPFVYASGLICFRRKCSSEEHAMPMIYHGTVC